MVPEVDKKDTYVQLDELRTQIETTRQDILALEFETITAEKEALRKLATRSFQQARQWTGRMLGELGRSTPYPNSSDPATQTIDPSTVATDPTRPTTGGLSIVQRIKAARAHMKELDAQLEEMVSRCIPGSRFNQFLFKVQEHTLQAGMWLGELLAEHFDEQPKAEAKTYDLGPQHSPETLADIAAVESLGTRVVARSFVPGQELPGTIEHATAAGGYSLRFDSPAHAGTYWVDLLPTVAEAIKAYDIVSEAVASGESDSPLAEKPFDTIPTSDDVQPSGSAPENELPSPSSEATAPETLADSARK